MTHTVPRSEPAVPRRIRPEHTWDMAREQYLAGASAEEVCRRHDLGLSAFKVRARQGNWRRIDQPAPDPIDDDIDMDAPAEPRERMLGKAWRRLSQALDAGRSTEAVRWMRVHAMLLAAERTEARERDRDTAEEMRAITRTARGIEAQASSMIRQVEAEAPGLKRRVHTVHSKKSPTAPPPPPDPDEPGLSRAERRRRLKYQAKGP